LQGQPLYEGYDSTLRLRKLSLYMIIFLQPSSKVSPSLPFQTSKSVVCVLPFFASRVGRLSFTISMTWTGRVTRGTSLRVPSSLYLPGYTNSVFVMSIFAIYLFSSVTFGSCTLINIAFPAVVSRYFCILLRGLSGMVISRSPLASKGPTT
jgi:hypothetical protein